MDTALVPNAVFHYDISPVMVVVREETQAFASFVTKICAVIGGIYTAPINVISTHTYTHSKNARVPVLRLPAAISQGYEVGPKWTQTFSTRR